MIKLDTIQLNPQNPRTIKDVKFKKLVKSIKESTKFLEARPIVVKDGVVFGGNMRLRALQELGYTEVPDEWVKDVSGWTAEDIRKFIVVDNVAYGDNDWDLLSEQYEKEELEEWGMDVDKWHDDEVVEDEVPEVTDNPVSKLGEVYQLGRHRLMCGDSTKIEDVEKLMDGKKADMVFTDPPYGVDYTGGHAVKGVRRDKLENDDTPDIYSDGLLRAVEASKDGAAFYVWYSDSKSLAVLQAVLQAGLEVRNHIIWNKNLAQFGAIGAQYKSKHEPLLYMFKKGKSPQWFGPTNEISVWECDRASVNEFHPTQKPVGLPSRALKNSSKQDDIILDLFLGSGSTLIACEQTNRICYGMEIDPKYIDVIRKRYAKFIGKEEEWETLTPKI